MLSDERFTCHHANVLAIHTGGDAAPSATADALDATKIEAWIRRSNEATAHLTGTMGQTGQLLGNTTFPPPGWPALRHLFPRVVASP